jgi:plasmid maintenance system antidote protein VapI
MKTAKLIPYRTLGIEYFIREQMKYRDWDNCDMSEKSGIDSLELNSLLEIRKHLTNDTAKALANVFGSSYQYWMNLDSKSNQNTEKL